MGSTSTLSANSLDTQRGDLKTTMVYAKMGLGTMQAAVDTLQKRYELPMPSVVVGSPLPDEEGDSK